MRTVARFMTRVRAEHAIEFLRNNKIEAILWSDDVGGLNPAIGFVETYEVRVASGHVSIARDLLSDFGIADPLPEDGDDEEEGDETPFDTDRNGPNRA